MFQKKLHYDFSYYWPFFFIHIIRIWYFKIKYNEKFTYIHFSVKYIFFNRYN